MQITRSAPIAVARRPITPAKPARAQGAVQTTGQVVGTVAGGAAGFMGGGMLGWAVWFFANVTGRALTSNVIGVIGLAGLAVGAALGFKSGKFWGGAVEETLK